MGETNRCIIQKLFFMVKTNILEAVDNLQLCAGQEARCEAAVHAMHSLFHFLLSKLYCLLLSPTPSIP